MSVLFSHDQKKAKMRGTLCIPCFLVAALWVGCSSLSLTIPTSPVFGRVGGDVILNLSLNPLNVVLQAVTWRVNNTNNVVTCVGAAVSYGQGYEGRAHLNTMTGSLSLFRLTLRDSGQYSVSITTEGGSASGSVTLQVLDPVSVPTIQSNVPNPVEFNDTVTLTCTSSGSDVSYRWFNDSSEVSDTQRIHLSADNRTLTISGVLRSDDGPFYCYVYNHVSSNISSPFSLNVKYGPELPILSVSPNKPVYAAGSSLILQCSAQSNPTAQYQWFLNGTSLNKRGQELEIRNIQVDQAGNYTCWDFNDVTLRYAAVHTVIDVREPVSDVEIRPSPPEPIKNHTFSLTCEAAHTQSFLWLKDGKPLVFNGRISLTENDQTVFFQQVLHSDEGVYQCTASNMVSNMASKGFTLILNTPLPGAVFTTEKLAGMIIGSFLGGVLLAVIAFLVANSIRRGPLCRKVSNIKADINESPSSTYENVLNTNRMDKNPSLQSPSTDHLYMGLQPRQQSVYHSHQGKMLA